VGIPQSPQKEVALVSLLNHVGVVCCPVGPQEFEVRHMLHCHTVDLDGRVCVTSPPEVLNDLFCLFFVLSSSLLASHHIARWSTLSLKSDSLLSLMRPITVVSSAYLIMVLEPCKGLQ